jgi:type II secretory pathway component GspD/PulD (secretin)
MKNKLNVIIFTVVFLGLSPLLANAAFDIAFPNPEQAISMDLQDASVKDVLKIFSIQSGLNFIASENVEDRKTTIYLDKVLIKDAMDKIFMANNLSYELDTESKIFIVKDWGKPEVETVTRVFYLKYATVSSSPLKNESSTTATSGTTTSGTTTDEEEDFGITEAVKKLLSSGYGSVIEDPRINGLIVTDIPSKMPAITKLIAALDVPMPQVLLEVEMLDVNKSITDKVGFDFGSAGSYAMQIVSASKGTVFPLAAFANKGGDSGALADNVTAGTLSFPTTLKVVLDFLKTQTDTKFLARPRILTLNNQPAEIQIATEESIGVTTTTEASTSTTTATPERASTGVSLKVTPQINVDTGEITMSILPEVSEATQGNSFTSSGATFQYRDPETRSTKSLVRVKDGETVIVGGLIRNEFSEKVTKLPILGDIPLFGKLFTHRNNDKNKERELLVFITPHIVKDTSAKTTLAQAKKPGLPEREQDAFPLPDRQAAINSTLTNFEKMKK